MKIAIGSDHRGYEAKERIKALLLDMGLQIDDKGVHAKQASDYPDTGLAVAQDVADGRADRGILLCGSGIGMSITANKVRGVRAALCCSVEDARMTRRHNDSNVLALSERGLGDPKTDEIVKVWLSTPFEGGRHARRVEKIRAYEER